jgi:ATP-dependent DNA ligase
VLMTATEWDDVSMDPSGWWLSEKYDGMRLFWNGSQFFTRQGKKVKVPEFITSEMPNVALDGELWWENSGKFLICSGLNMDCIRKQSICVKILMKKNGKKPSFGFSMFLILQINLLK